MARGFNADAFAAKLNFMGGGATSSGDSAGQRSAEDDKPAEAKSWLGKLGQATKQATNGILPAGAASSVASISRATTGLIPDAVSGMGKEGIQRVASVTGRATGLARSATTSISEVAISRRTWMSFFGCFLLGCFFISLAFCFLPMLVLAPQKFALLFTLGSLFVLSSFSILRGHVAFIKHLLSRQRALFSTTYVTSMLGTLWASLIYRSQLLTILFSTVQLVSLSYFLVNYIPGGKRALSLFTGMAWRISKTCCRCASKGSILPF